MKRVMAVLPAPTFGGSANQVLKLHAPLRDRGWELIAVIPTDPGNVGARLQDCGVEVVRTPMHRLRATADPRTHLALARTFRSDVGRLRGLTRRYGAVVVMNHGDLNPHAALAGRLEGAAVHWQILDTRTPPALRRVTGVLLARWADSVSAVGQALADTHPGAVAVGDRCVIVFPPVDASAFAGSQARRAAARAELRIPDDALCVGAIGNRNPQKGQDWLVEAATIARQSEPRLAVRILGAPSPGHDRYETGLWERAAVAGLQEADGSFGITDPGDRVPELIGALDALVMPSVPNSEGMPTVILEAMAAGVPVVATDVGATTEVVTDRITGRIAAPEDAQGIADALLDVIGPAGPGYAEAGRHRIATEFTIDRLADRYAECFEVALRHRALRR